MRGIDAALRRSRNSRRAYTPERLFAELLQLFYNAFVFNPPDSVYFQSAHEVIYSFCLCVLFCFVLLCFILFYFVLFCFVFENKSKQYMNAKSI